jgi:vitamin B12 transporter
MKYPFLLSTLFLACSSALAQSTEQITITGSRSNLNPDSGREVTSISRAEIEASGEHTVLGLLARVAGVETTSNGGGLSNTAVFIRGGNSGHTLVLLDGQRVGSATTGATALQTFDLSQIERIEVLKGVGSSLYGSDALGGVIQLFSRAQNGVQLGLSAGSFRTLSANASVGQQSGDVRYSLSAQTGQSDGINAITNPKNFSYNPDKDGYKQSTLSAQVSAQVNPIHLFSARLSATQTDSAYDGGSEKDDRAKANISAAQLAWTARWSDAALTKLKLGLSEDVSEFKGDYPARYRSRTSELSLVQDLRLSESLAGYAGLDTRGESIKNNDGYALTSRNTTAAILGLQASLTEHRLGLNGRLDHSAQFGNVSTGGAVYRYVFNKQLSVNAQAHTGFRAPTFNDLYYPGYSNPNLKPEQARSFEAGLNYQSQDQAASLTAFQNQVRDLIVFVCDASFNCAPQNVANARLKGLSFSGMQQLGGTRINANLDWQSARNADTGQWLPRRAKVHGRVGVSQQWQALLASVEVVASGERFDSAGEKNRLPGYALLNSNVSYTISKAWQVQLKLSNLLNTRYNVVKDFATEGRAVQLSLKWSL